MKNIFDILQQIKLTIQILINTLQIKNTIDFWNITYI